MIDVDDAAALRATSSELAGFRSVPQVFVGGEIYGGADDTCEGLDAGDFEAKARRAASEGIPGAPAKLRDAADAWAAGAEARAAAKASAPSGGSSSWLTKLMKENASTSTTAVETARAMADEANGVPRRARRRFAGVSSGPFGMFKKYEGTFTAREAVDWMMKNGKAASESAAIELGEEMVNQRLIADVDATRGFDVVDDEADAPLYRLRADAPKLGCAPLNAGELFVGEACDAKTVIEDVRRRVSALYDDFLSDDGRVFDYRGAAESAAFKAFVDATHELQRVHLNGMNRDQRTAFFINLYNALVIHGTCVFGAPKTTLERLDFFSKTSYDVAGSTYTCDDIENGILRGNRPGAATLGALLDKPWLSRGPFREGDPRRNHVCAPADPRVHFALVCGARSCPPVRVYSSETLDAELEDAAFSFFESELDITLDDDGEVQSCAVSKIVGEWYKRDFGADDTARLRYVARYAKPGDARDALIRALDRGDAIALTTRPYDWTLNDGR